jgi:multicomponent Na+:H+ antiporter subunit D
MLLLAFSIKAAVFPLSFWLPDSYPTAPAPVTAVFAGLLTKVGVYAMIRTETQIFRDNDVNTLLLIVALATMIVGVLGALAQAELKRILSFTLVSHVGYLVFGLAIATPSPSARPSTTWSTTSSCRPRSSSRSGSSSVVPARPRSSRSRG